MIFKQANYSFISTFLLLGILLQSEVLADEDFLSNHISSHDRLSQLLINRSNSAYTIPLCYNYSCQKKDWIHVTQQDIQSIKSIFNSFRLIEDNAHYERLAIADAIAFFENLAGQQTPVNSDKGKNYNDDMLSGRMDCIDETFNTIHYLQFIDKLGVLKWHSIESPVYRSSWFMGQHWSAHIKDISSGKDYAVDSWEKDNGQGPIVQEISQWKNRDSIE